MMALSTLIYSLSVAVVIMILFPSSSADSIPLSINARSPGYREYLGAPVLAKLVLRETAAELICTAPVPATMSWFRMNDKSSEENMDTVCIGPDIEVTGDRKKKSGPPHCKLTRSASSITLSINRIRFGNKTLKTISDFRQYICRATNGGKQGLAVIDVVEKVFLKKASSRPRRSVKKSTGGDDVHILKAVEGEVLDLYCDAIGVVAKEFKAGTARLVWTKDGQPFDGMKYKRAAEIVKKFENGTYRSGFRYCNAGTDLAGFYTCELTRDGKIYEGNDFARLTFYVKIRDKIGAVWPFLGLCAEVLILCIMIVVYQKVGRNKEPDDEEEEEEEEEEEGAGEPEKK